MYKPVDTSTVERPFDDSDTEVVYKSVDTSTVQRPASIGDYIGRRYRQKK